MSRMQKSDQNLLSSKIFRRLFHPIQDPLQLANAQIQSHAIENLRGWDERQAGAEVAQMSLNGFGLLFNQAGTQAGVDLGRKKQARDKFHANRARAARRWRV